MYILKRIVAIFMFFNIKIATSFIFKSICKIRQDKQISFSIKWKIFVHKRKADITWPPKRGPPKFFILKSKK